MTTVKASDAMRGRTLTINVKLVKDWRFRLGFWILKFGARVMRLSVKENHEP